MKLALLAVALVGTLGSIAGRAAADDLYPCRPPAADAKLDATFHPDLSLRELTTWLAGATCKTVIFTPEVAQRATRINIVSPTRVTPKQAVQLFIDAVDATGLVVVQKGDTLIVKPGRGMPASCPDVAAAEAPPARAADLPDATLAAGIHAVDTTHVTVARAIVRAVIFNLPAIPAGVRIVPMVVNGAPGGWKLYAIHPGSIYARVGLLNGDNLRSINDLPIDSDIDRLDTVSQLQAAGTLRLQITRAGKPLEITLTVN